MRIKKARINEVWLYTDTYSFHVFPNYPNYYVITYAKL